MLKTVSSITNAIGALNYKGTWDASTNTPALVSGTGTKGDYYVVSVAGATNLDGISNWGIGDWAVFNGSAWQRVEGGADLNGVNLSVSGTSTLSGLTASTALALNANKQIVSVTNTGSGNNVLGTSPSIATPTLTGDVSMSTGNLVVGTAGKGVDFSASSHAAGMTSELLDDYERGTWTPSIGGNATYFHQWGSYVKVGRQVTVTGFLYINILGTGSTTTVSGLPFTSSNTYEKGCLSFGEIGGLAVNVTSLQGQIPSIASTIVFFGFTGASSSNPAAAIFQNLTVLTFSVTYIASS